MCNFDFKTEVTKEQVETAMLIKGEYIEKDGKYFIGHPSVLDGYICLCGSSLNYEELLKEAEQAWKAAREYYTNLRSQCEHTRTIYKNKYGGYYCEVCETFLPRGPK